MKKLCDTITNAWLYVVAAVIILVCVGWAYGMQSRAQSLLYQDKKVTRSELAAELKYLIEIAKSRDKDLAKQDEAKQALVDAANIFTTGGNFNPMGLLNTAISIAAISFGLDRQKKLKAAKKETV